MLVSRQPLGGVAALVKEWRPDIARATRATAGIILPLLLAETGRIPLHVIFAAIAAQNVAMADVRGSYSLRLAILSAGALLLGLAAALGSMSSQHLWIALMFAAVMAVVAGGLRHLSADYGPPLAAPTVFLFLLALAAPPGHEEVLSHLISTWAGGALGIVLQMALWPFRPQHPLRRATAECWQEAANTVGILNDDAWPNANLKNDAIAAQQVRLREALDRTLVTLDAAESKRMRPIVARLKALHLLSARFATQALALDTAMETRGMDHGLAEAAGAFQPVFQSLENMARSVAITIVSRQPSHLTALDVRLRRLTNLLAAARTGVIARSLNLPLGGHLVAILKQIESLVPEIKAAVRETTDRASERGAFSLELLDLHTWRLGSLPAALNLSPRVDRALLRFILRLGTLLALSVFVYKWFEIPHGYWLGLTLVVVMQPDYGSTRQRAAERVLGTVLGSVLASGLLFLHPPHAALLTAAAIVAFFFALFLKRRYDVAVVFLTVMVVLLTEIGGSVTWELTFERLACTLAGGGLALLAAHIFWPAWEKDRFQPLMTEALLASRDYIKLLCRCLREGMGRIPELVPAKRHLETANREVFASLRRMYGEPKNRADILQDAAAMANGNLRLTRVLNLLLLHLANKPPPVTKPELTEWEEAAASALEILACTREECDDQALRQALSRLEGGELICPKPGGDHDSWVFTQLARASTELSAMLIDAIPDIARSKPGQLAPH
jgi:uncharacterized membrane protein YccC